VFAVVATEISKKVLINNPSGFHMRPKAAFVEAASKFDSDVKLVWSGQAFNGKSMFELMLVAAPQGDEIELFVQGSDAPEAFEHLEKILAEVEPSQE
jgi:phosphocarrier protein HPr